MALLKDKEEDAPNEMDAKMQNPITQKSSKWFWWEFPGSLVVKTHECSRPKT